MLDLSFLAGMDYTIILGERDVENVDTTPVIL